MLNAQTAPNGVISTAKTAVTQTHNVPVPRRHTPNTSQRKDAPLSSSLQSAIAPVHLRDSCTQNEASPSENSASNSAICPHHNHLLFCQWARRSANSILPCWPTCKKQLIVCLFLLFASFFNNFVAVDKKEIANWYVTFMRQFPAGVVTRTDLCDMYAKYYPYGHAGPFVDLLFKLFDTNNNGAIEFDEFIRGLSLTARGKLDEKLAWAFRFYDVDEDGAISYADMLFAMRAFYELVGNSIELPADEETPEKRTTKLFGAINVSQSGFITPEEFKIAAKLDPVVVHGLVMYDGVL